MSYHAPHTLTEEHLLEMEGGEEAARPAEAGRFVVEASGDLAVVRGELAEHRSSEVWGVYCAQGAGGRELCGVFVSRPVALACVCALGLKGGGGSVRRLEVYSSVGAWAARVPAGSDECAAAQAGWSKN